MESGDIMIMVAPSQEPGIRIDLTSSVAFQFGNRIKEVISETINDFGGGNVQVTAIDKGALDCTIRARVTAAMVRATGNDVWKD